MEWISKEDMVPLDGERVICYCKSGGILVLKEVKADWHSKKYNVTHWFYPEKPKE